MANETNYIYMNILIYRERDRDSVSSLVRLIEQEEQKLSLNLPPVQLYSIDLPDFKS